MLVFSKKEWGKFRVESDREEGMVLAGSRVEGAKKNWF